MPSLRGIEVSIVTQSSVGTLPEYPHPDEPCYQEPCAYKAPKDGQPAACAPDQQDATENDPDLSHKASPRISVYVPSIPGSQFSIKYAVERETSPSSHLFFKLHMNGRHITSWGINPKIKSKGRVEKALYEPSDRWCQEENGVLFKPEGIEARYFYFINAQQQLSVADDGGLVEIHVFRAKGRKRRAARLDEYRHMDRYGITAPSGGLVDNPQDVTYFDFHLIDPKDTPFATFRFHYRSLTNLRQLNLIPTEDPDTLFPSPIGTAKKVTKSISKGSFTILEDEPTAKKVTESISKGSFAILEDDPTAKKVAVTISKGSFNVLEDESCTEDHQNNGCQEPDESIFDDSTESFPRVTPVKSKQRRNSSYVLRTPPQLRPRSASNHNVPQPSKTIRDALPPGFPDAYLSRPLPNLPIPDLPRDDPTHTCIPRSRKCSTASATPSIAPSLLSYVDNVSYVEEDVQYGQALEVPISKDHPGVPLNQEQTISTVVSDSARADVSTPVGVSDTSISNYEVSPLSMGDSKDGDPALLSPGNYLETGNSLETHLASPGRQETSPNKELDSSGESQSLAVKRVDTGALALDLARFPHLQLCEAEWLRQTPSPERAPRRILSPRLGRLWNTLRRHKSRSPLRKDRGESATRNRSTPQLAGPEARDKNGNWI